MRKTLLFALILISITSFSQESDSTNKIQFKATAEYLSNYVYNGRADSLKSPYFTTSLELKKGEFTLTGLAYMLLQNNNQRFDYFELDGAYEHDFNDKLSMGLYASKYFSSSQRTSINSDITSSVGGSLTYDFSLFKFSTESDLLFSSKSDVYINLEFDKEVKFESNNLTYTIDPTVDMNYSTTNYYEGTITKNAQKRKKNQLVTQNSINSTSVINQGMRLMDYEVSIPLTIENKKIGFSFTPTYFLPFNSVKTISHITTGAVTTTLDSTPYSELHLEKGLYLQASVFFKF